MTLAHVYPRVHVDQSEESKQGQTVDALALGGDEGRDKLRKARGRRKWPLIPGCPNGATRHLEGVPSCKQEANVGN